MYKVNDLVEHKKSGVTYKVLYSHNDVLFAVNDKDVAKSMGIDDVVPAKSEREKAVEDMLSFADKSDNLEKLLGKLFDAGYRKVADKSSEDNDGWIEWDGSDRFPFSDDAIVEYKMRDGVTCTEFAKNLLWRHLGACYDIIAYRIIKKD